MPRNISVRGDGAVCQMVKIVGEVAQNGDYAKNCHPFVSFQDFYGVGFSDTQCGIEGKQGTHQHGHLIKIIQITVRKWHKGKKGVSAYGEYGQHSEHDSHGCQQATQGRDDYAVFQGVEPDNTHQQHNDM